MAATNCRARELLLLRPIEGGAEHSAMNQLRTVETDVAPYVLEVSEPVALRLSTLSHRFAQQVVKAR